MIVDRQSIGSKRAAWLLFFAPLALVPLSEIWRIVDPESYLLFVWEDHLLEYIEVLVLSMCSVFLALTSYEFRKISKRYFVIYLVGTFLVIFVALEEISYFQRILGLATPEYFLRNNIQNEISFHNHSTFGFGGTNDIWAVLFVAGAMGYLSFSWLLLPERFFKSVWWAHFLVPSWYLCTYFMLPTIWLEYFPFGGLTSNPVPERSEIAEGIFYSGALVFAALRYRLVRNVTRCALNPNNSQLRT